MAKRCSVHMIKAVIFDMDGVLIDSEFYWEKREGNFFKEYIPKWNKQDQKQIVGMTMKAIHTHLKQKHNCKMTWPEYKETINNTAKIIYGEETNLLPDVLETLKLIKQLKLKIALVSSSPIEWINIVLKRFNLKQYFNVIISGQTSNLPSKPDPTVYKLALKKLKIDPNEAIVVEDTKNGATSAKNANIKTIGIKNGFNQSQDLTITDKMIKNFIELQEIIKKEI